MEDYAPIIGKTYSLFGNGHSTNTFYLQVAGLVDEMLESFNNSEKILLEYIRTVSSNRRRLRKSAGQSPGASKLAFLLNRTHEVLYEFTGNIDQHIRSVSLRKHITDRDLLTSREQYYLYMLEFELINRISRILKENGINPYILSRGRVRNLIMEQYTIHGSIGVLGIACIVELVQGM